MKFFRKIKIMLVIGVFLITTIWTFNPIENVKADAEEFKFDEKFIN